MANARPRRKDKDPGFRRRDTNQGRYGERHQRGSGHRPPETGEVGNKREAKNPVDRQVGDHQPENRRAQLGPGDSDGTQAVRQYND